MWQATWNDDCSSLTGVTFSCVFIGLNSGSTVKFQVTGKAGATGTVQLLASPFNDDYAIASAARYYLPTHSHPMLADPLLLRCLTA